MAGVVDSNGACGEATRIAVAPLPKSWESDSGTETIAATAIPPVPERKRQRRQAARVRLLGVLLPPGCHTMFFAVPFASQCSEAPTQWFVTNGAKHATFEGLQRHGRMDLLETPVERKACRPAVPAQLAPLTHGRVKRKSESDVVDGGAGSAVHHASLRRTRDSTLSLPLTGIRAASGRPLLAARQRAPS